MSWLLKLYETYELNQDRVGEFEIRSNGQEFTLLPVSHTTQNAHIEVTVTQDGEFHSARVVEKNEAETIIPATVDSAERAGAKIAPFPLHDKLVYVAGDFIDFFDVDKAKRESYEAYIKQLELWVSSPFGHPKVKSIYLYVRKGRLIQDLIDSKILFLDNNKLIRKWEDHHQRKYGFKPPIFSVLPGDLENAFVRFNVRTSQLDFADIWKDKEVIQSFIQYLSNYSDGYRDLCYITGKKQLITDKHAKRIRNAGDKAKLISANDDIGFTFRGRLNKDFEAACLSYEVSQKAHNALKWLIQKQGKIIGNRAFLVWGNDHLDVPNPLEDTFSLAPAPIKQAVPTNQEFAREVTKALQGYRSNLDINSKSEVNILILDSATQGRMAVLYYRNLNKEFYLERLKQWHTSCVWLHRYRKDETGKYVTYLGAPSLRDISYAAYGSNADDKLVKGLMERLLPCIIDSRQMPLDVINSAFYRASNPVSMESWEWEKTLSIACALINRREGYEVALDPNNNHRDYLFGRMLAVADVLERRALGPDEGRATNAIRFMNSFARYPARTWKTIQENLQPYQVKLGSKGVYLSKIIDEIASKMKADDFNNKPLSGLYLLGFYSQRHELYQKRDQIDFHDEISE